MTALPGHRRAEYTPELGNEICTLVAETIPVHKIAKMPGMPCASTIYKWLNEFKDFSDNYTRAREIAADTWGFDTIAIADEAPETIKGVEKAALRVRTRQWAAERSAAKKWGAKQAVNLGGGDTPVEVKQEIDWTKVPDAIFDALYKSIAEGLASGDPAGEGKAGS